LEFASCDVREEDQVQAALERAAAHAGGLRIAVCCAGTGWAQKVAGSKGPHPLMPFATIIQINLIGTFNVLRLAATAMIASEPLGQDSKRGVCINTASIAAFDGQVGQIAYSASKGHTIYPRKRTDHCSRAFRGRRSRSQRSRCASSPSPARRHS
jgi:NAD(P)-dependent dehydrogenase (short-subunit alcohol dehydrogenase family)